MRLARIICSRCGHESYIQPQEWNRSTDAQRRCTQLVDVSSGARGATQQECGGPLVRVFRKRLSGRRFQ